jgi:hypothetical protein
MEKSNSRKRSKRFTESKSKRQKPGDFNSEQKDIIASWVLYALRELMTYEDIRNTILLEQLYNDKKLYHLGHTYSYVIQDDLSQIKKDLKKIPKNKITVFTASNIVPDDVVNPETHFQSYIVNPMKKKLTVIDPAMSFEEAYHREISNQLIIPHFENLGYEIYLLPNHCQKSTRDVYCQTWTLYLLIQELQQPLNPDDIYYSDKNANEKKQILKDFYDSVVTIDVACKKLDEIYSDNIIPIVNKYPFLFFIDPCNYIKQLQIKDF